MNLNDIQKSCMAEASIIKDYNELSKNELVNAYCDLDEKIYLYKDKTNLDRTQILMSAYWAAILLRYWYKIFEWLKTSSSLGLEATDYFDWLNDSLHDAFYYRSWRKKRREHPNIPDSDWIDNPQYVEDENAADKSINYFTGAKRGKEYQAANKQKRRSNYQSLSIDSTFDEEGYSILDREGLSVKGSSYNGLHELVNLFLEQDKLIEAVIIDSIANGESIKDEKYKYQFTTKVIEDNEEKEVTEEVQRANYMFDARKVVKYLNSINENYFTKYFNKTYNVKNYKEILTQLKKLNNNKLYREIEKTLATLRNNKELLGYIRA